MRRREFLGTGLLGAAAVLAGGRAWAADTTVAELPWWDRGNYRPVMRERVAEHLEVEGTLPRSLTGLYVRNGSNEHAGVPAHWFVGDGMLHGVWLEQGRARAYRSSWVQTETLANGGATSSGPPSIRSGYANVSAIWHAGRLLASGEIGLPWELDPHDLATVGAYDFAGALTTSMTAHPKIDPATGALHFFGYWFAPPFLTYHVADASGALVHSEPVDLPRSTMMHDFAITERDVVFWDFPVVFDASAIATGIPYRWKPEAGARIGVMPLGGPASAIRWVEIEPGYVFHSVNAHRDGDDVIVDVCHYTKMFDPGVTDDGTSSLRRWRIGTGGEQLTFADEVVAADDPGELPSRDPRRVGRPNRYGYLLSSHEATDGSPNFAGVIKQDFRTGDRTRWRPERGLHAGEFLFVPDGRHEDDGHLLAYAYDDATRRSRLVVLDARDVAAGPVATVALPTRVPFGFHATWVPGDDSLPPAV